MKLFTRSRLYFLPALLSASLVSSCGSNDEPLPKDTGMTVLMYAVASNNLYGNLVSDKEEILKAAKDMDLSGLRFLIYQVTPYGNPQLLELKKTSGADCDFVTVKEFSKDLYSTDPKRISEVIDGVKSEVVSEKYGLILWSHGTGIDPSFSTHTPGSRSESVSCADGIMAGSANLLYSFGSDRDSDKNNSYYDETDIHELADAIPDRMFDFIWFDACYMGGIETAYQLRNKCRWFVGYPTEVYTPGMPYDLTIPYILRKTPDLPRAAEAFFNYYAKHSSSSWRVATVAVADMNGIQGVADYCKKAYKNASTPSASGLQTYSRGNFGPFYDFGQYTGLMARSSQDAPDISEFEKAMDRFIVYSAATPTDFNFNTIYPEHFCGLSCYRYSASFSTDKAKYYKTLDWCRDVYPEIETE